MIQMKGNIITNSSIAEPLAWRRIRRPLAERFRIMSMVVEEVHQIQLALKSVEQRRRLEELPGGGAASGDERADPRAAKAAEQRAVLEHRGRLERHSPVLRECVESRGIVDA